MYPPQITLSFKWLGLNVERTFNDGSEAQKLFKDENNDASCRSGLLIWEIMEELTSFTN